MYISLNSHRVFAFCRIRWDTLKNTIRNGIAPAGMWKVLTGRV